MKLNKCLDKLIYDNKLLEQDKFKMSECVICINKFENGTQIIRIPAC